MYSWAERNLLREKCQAITTTDTTTLHDWLLRVFNSEEDGYQPPGVILIFPTLPFSILPSLLAGEDVDKLELVREQGRSPRTNHSVHFMCPEMDRS